MAITAAQLTASLQQREAPDESTHTIIQQFLPDVAQAALNLSRAAITDICDTALQLSKTLSHSISQAAQTNDETHNRIVARHAKFRIQKGMICH